jgi:hypothetical protein
MAGDTAERVTRAKKAKYQVRFTIGELLKATTIKEHVNTNLRR